MNKKVLMGCYEVPGFGGANTVGYRLFEQMQSGGIDVEYVNLINELDYDYFLYLYGSNFGNPKLLKNVHNSKLSHRLFKIHENLTELLEEISPDIILGVGYIAANLLRISYPRPKLIYLTTGCVQVKRYLEKDAALDSIQFERQIENTQVPIVYDKPEQKTVEKSNLIITHSELIHKYYSMFFPSCRSKIHQEVFSFAPYIYADALEYKSLAKDFDDRQIDVLFVSSLWDRVEKNTDMVKQIIRSCQGLNVHIVGEIKSKIGNSTSHGIVADRQKLFEIIGDAKTIVCPSKFDAAPGILFEGSAMGCNLIASKNCGNWDLCNSELLVDRYSKEEFVSKINISISSKYQDNIDIYLGDKGYENLIDLMTLM